MSEDTPEIQALVANLRKAAIELQESRRPFDERIAALSKQILDARIAISGVKIGDIVKNSRGKVFKVSAIQPSSYGKAFLRGFQRTKDGKFGTLERSIWSDWELMP